MSSALIVAGGTVDLTQLHVELAKQPELIIAADGGGTALAALKVYPDLLLGDLDSIAPEIVSDFRLHGVELQIFPTNKDQTDLQLALEFAYQKGFKNIRVLGALGGRLDHTLGNLGLLCEALQQSATVWLLDPVTEVTLISDRIELPARAGWAVSLIPFTELVQGITTQGLKYQLCNENLSIRYTKGIHNEFIADFPFIEIKITQGILTVILFQEKQGI